MPTTRTRRSRNWSADLDEYRQQELREGLGTVLLAGCGYFADHLEPMHTITSDQYAAAREVARVDWAKHGKELMDLWGDPEPWAKREFGAPRARWADAH